MTKLRRWVIGSKKDYSIEHIVPEGLLRSQLLTTPNLIYTTNSDNKILSATHLISGVEPPKVPSLCELLLCVTVEPKFQKDRLGDYEERFADLWVPKFGRRAAVVVYVWHVLRQSRLIDWLIRAFGWGAPR
jgi:hypothetical protein